MPGHNDLVQKDWMSQCCPEKVVILSFIAADSCGNFSLTTLDPPEEWWVYSMVSKDTDVYSILCLTLCFLQLHLAHCTQFGPSS